MYPSDTLFYMKDVGLRIRIQRELRDRFMEACREQDKPAAQVLREYMRDYAKRYETKSLKGSAGKRKWNGTASN